MMPIDPEPGSSLLLSEMTWLQVRDLLSGIQMVLIPVGSTEQHGPNLSLRMDTAGASEFCRLASAMMHPRLLVAPAMPFGVSPHHMHFPGTVSLSSATFVNVLLEVINSLHVHGFQRFMIVNGHGGNVASINIVAERAKHELGVTFAGACTYFSFFDEASKVRFGAGPITGHACEIETSVALHLMPEIVHHSTLAAGEMTPLAEFLRGDLRAMQTSVPYFFEQYTANGALGDARKATPEFGAALIESGLSRFCRMVEQILAFEVGGATA